MTMSDECRTCGLQHHLHHVRLMRNYHHFVPNDSLIDAAPDLLEALKACREFIGKLPIDGTEGYLLCVRADKAIAKASGEIVTK
jgi:hypothetical protein